MKKELLKQMFKTEEEEIELVVKQTDKGLIIDINGQTMDVNINGESFYSRYENEEYKYIPPTLRQFIEKYADESSIAKEKSKIQCYLTIEGYEYFCEIDTKRAKNNFITLINDLNSYEKIEEMCGVQIPNKEDRYNRLIADIEETGYKFKLSHGGNEYDDFYSLIIQINEFDEKLIIDCINKWVEYNNQLDEYVSY